MDKEMYQKYLNAMRRAYQAVTQDVDHETFHDQAVMFELTVDEDRMHMYGGITMEEQNYFYADVPHSIKWEMFKKIT